MTSVNPQRQPVGNLLTHHLLGLYQIPNVGLCPSPQRAVLACGPYIASGD